MTPHIKTIVQAGAGLLTAGAILVAGQEAQPINEVKDAVSSPGDVHSFCPDGWEADIVRIDGEHVQSLLCLRDGVTVILYPDGTFNLAERNGDFILDASEVPGWAR